MEVVEIRHMEDCFDGSLIKEILLAENIFKEQIYALGEGGHIQYFPDFPRPFYKIRISGLYDLKGIEGNSTMRVHLKSPETFPLEKFIDLLSGID
jgi:hypothetical protein